MAEDFQRPFINKNDLLKYVATDGEISALYGQVVRAVEMSNVDYAIRYRKQSIGSNMKSPPRHGRIFSGYLVIRNLDKQNEYETWIPDDAFEDMYILQN